MKTKAFIFFSLLICNLLPAQNVKLDIVPHFFGYIGMVAGIGVTEWMNSAFGTQTADTGMFQARMFSDPTVDIGIAIQATLTLIIAGTLAGFFPARKAVSISPIEALRAD